ncbi:2OG-Fe(II) oxygenase [Methyloceanibacter sp.]|uniref:2OG-Fe(II) oxygenase n=1 Tax=Methyloceanibacter sp. TaxID=1965321 RepID=UPI002D49383B|nr:2OG-Fe(II) oxygenase [Methyloceanibacter sp.]HZP09702.1 2OG-Fe(II) oxygenase [Methyloceanibacter sp.]
MRESVAVKHPIGRNRPSTAADIVTSFIRSVDTAKKSERPYPNWALEHCFPVDTVEDILALPFEPPSLDGVSGKRELHNNTRKYFDVDNRKRFPVCEAVAQAFQDKRVTGHIEKVFGTDLGGTYLRIEFAQDIDGFWLEPHTDLGVKVFTMLLYLSTDPSHKDLGTDIYDINKQHVGRSAFASNAAMVFVPSNDTYHGFEKRPIKGVRTSLIINYVTNEWRAREQLSFPDAPIA